MSLLIGGTLGCFHRPVSSSEEPSFPYFHSILQEVVRSSWLQQGRTRSTAARASAPSYLRGLRRSESSRIVVTRPYRVGVGFSEGQSLLPCYADYGRRATFTILCHFQADRFYRFLPLETDFFRLQARSGPARGVSDFFESFYLGLPGLTHARIARPYGDASRRSETSFSF